jgi:hypothetical protein
LQLTEDGGIVLSDGYGSRILLTGGQVRIESAGDIVLTSAARVVSLARDVILRAQDNIDLSAALKDVRIKAENNLQLLGGNSGAGGILLESKGQGTSQLYEQRIGNEVVGSGITLLAKGSSVNAIGQDIYVRSGVSQTDLGSGAIVLDAGKGEGSIQYRAASHTMTARSGLFLLHVDQEGEPTDFHRFSAATTEIPGMANVAAGLFVRSADIRVAGSISASGSIQAGGRLAGLGGPFSVGDTSRSFIQSSIDSAKTAYDQSKSVFLFVEKTRVSSQFDSRFYAPDQPGADELLLSAMGFSFRDTPDRPYGYATGGFKFLETRWQQLARVGATSAQRTPWQEPPVLYQGRQQQPWPGTVNWEDPSLASFLAYAGSTAEPNSFDFVDPSVGLVKPRAERQNKMESPELADWVPNMPCASGFTL